MIFSIYKTLSRSERLNLFSISFFTLCSIIIELVGLSLIIPISKIILDSNFYEKLLIEYGSVEVVKNYSKEQFVFIIIIAFFIIFILKTFFLSILSYRKFSFVNRLIKERTLKLYDVYLKQNIAFFKNTHSSKLIKNLINEMFLLSALFNSIIILLSESFFSFIIVLGISIYNFYIFFSLVIYTLIIFLIYKSIFKNRIHFWGNERQTLQAKITKDFMETFGAIKELIIYDKSDFFKKRINDLFGTKLKLDIKFSTINEIPKYFIELIALVGFFLISITLYLNGTEKNDLLVILIFFSALLFKVLPSISRIINSIQQIKFYYPANELISNEISRKKEVETYSKERINFNHSIRLNNIDFSYENKKILKNYSLNINKGERVLIVGKSGKGKSTLIDIIAGFNEQYSGEYLVDDKPLRNLVEWRKKIGYLSQSFFILDDTIKNNIIFNEEYDHFRFEKIIKLCSISEILKSKLNGIETIIGERGALLSGGEKQRIGLARALYRNPEIIILDEPTSSLDEDTANEFVDSLLSVDKFYTLIMVSHNSLFKSKFDKIIEIK